MHLREKTLNDILMAILMVAGSLMVINGNTIVHWLGCIPLIPSLAYFLTRIK